MDLKMKRYGILAWLQKKIGIVNILKSNTLTV